MCVWPLLVICMDLPCDVYGPFIPRSHSLLSPCPSMEVPEHLLDVTEQDKLEKWLDSKLQSGDVQALSKAAGKVHTSFKQDKRAAVAFVATIKAKWQRTPTVGMHGMVTDGMIHRYGQLILQLQQKHTDLALCPDGGKPIGSFNNAGSSAKFRALVDGGMSLTDAKDRLIRPTLAQLVKDSPAVTESNAAAQQRDRVNKEIAEKAAVKPMVLLSVKAIVGVQVQPGIQAAWCDKERGGLRYKEKHMRCSWGLGSGT